MKKSALMALVNRMQQGDEQAFNEIYKEFNEPLYYIALELTCNEADAKDVVQETFIQLHRSIHTLKEPTVFVLWTKRILTNKCRNLYRARRDTIYNDEVISSQLDRKAQKFDVFSFKKKQDTSRKVLHGLVKQLNYLQKEVIVLHYFDQLKLKEIASMLDVSEGTIKSRMNSAKKSLRTLCDKYEKINHERISMQSMGMALSGMYASMYVPTFLGRMKYSAQGSLATSSFTSILISASALVCVGAVATPILRQTYFKEKTPMIKQESVKETQTATEYVGDQEAYFALRSWSHCIDEMMEKDYASFQEIHSYFERLKAHEGVYWDALIHDEWADDYETMYQKLRK